MFGSYILDVAIGLVFVYMLLSLLCSTINEQVIARIFSLRAKTLRTGIQNMLADQDGSLTQQIYENPLIQGLSQYSVTGNPRDPSYIPSNIFAEAVLALDVVKAYKNDLVAQDSTIPKALGILLKKANYDPQKALASIEQWYDDTMDRVSGWYRRNVQLIIFILGFIIVGLLNIDTIAIITNLSNDTVVRAGLVSAVQGSAASSTHADLPTLQKVFEQIQPAIGWSSSSLPTNGLSWFLKIVGLLATIFAISLGAPFWFDLLNKFVSFRSSGAQIQASTRTDGAPAGSPAQPSVSPAGAPASSPAQPSAGTAGAPAGSPAQTSETPGVEPAPTQ
jgi:hypothetical protein